jgi:hypothetical protein
MTTFTEAFAAIQTAFDRASGQWTGIDWTTDGSESYTAQRVEADAEADAEAAQEAAEEAMAHYNEGNLVQAREYAATACDYERAYGDCPTWRSLHTAIQAAIEALHDEEIDPDLAVTTEEIASLRAAAVQHGDERMVEIIDAGETPEVVAEAVWQAQVEAAENLSPLFADQLDIKDDRGGVWHPSTEVRARLHGHYRPQTMALLYCLRAPHRGVWQD